MTGVVTGGVVTGVVAATAEDTAAGALIMSGIAPGMTRAGCEGAGMAGA